MGVAECRPRHHKLAIVPDGMLEQRHRAVDVTGNVEAIQRARASDNRKGLRCSSSAARECASSRPASECPVERAKALAARSISARSTASASPVSVSSQIAGLVSARRRRTTSTGDGRTARIERSKIKSTPRSSTERGRSARAFAYGTVDSSKVPSGRKLLRGYSKAPRRTRRPSTRPAGRHWGCRPGGWRESLDAPALRLPAGPRQQDGACREREDNHRDRGRHSRSTRWRALQSQIPHRPEQLPIRLPTGTAVRPRLERSSDDGR